MSKAEIMHKVFKGMAQSGKCSMGWFFGFKLHLIEQYYHSKESPSKYREHYPLGNKLVLTNNPHCQYCKGRRNDCALRRPL